MNKLRRIAVVTGSRSEYGLLRPVMRAISDQRILELSVIVTGMHLLRRFGRTLDDIRNDGWQIAGRVPMQTGRDSALSQSRALARGIDGIAAALQRLSSDAVVVLGDRIEALAGALAAVTTDRIVAHIHGGDVAPGHLDDAFRHAVTKLAHIHFAATRDSADRIMRLGEVPKNVHFVGAPGLDGIKSVSPPPRHWLAERFGLTAGRDVALIIQHPVGRPPEREEQCMKAIVGEVHKANLNGVVFYPNSDAGHSGIVKAIREHASAMPRGTWAEVKSLPREEFLRCLMGAKLLVGNSSSGIIESHSAKTPAVNVGARQDGRVRCGPGVVDCSEQPRQIRRAVQTALHSRFDFRPRKVYGSGQAGKRIAGILASTQASDKLRRKRIVY